LPLPFPFIVVVVDGVDVAEVEVEEVAGRPSRSISWNALGLSVRRLRTSLNAWGSVEPDIVVLVGIGWLVD
jgi:hypothetical protein